MWWEMGIGPTRNPETKHLPDAGGTYRSALELSLSKIRSYRTSVSAGKSERKFENLLALRLLCLHCWVHELSGRKWGEAPIDCGA